MEDSIGFAEHIEVLFYDGTHHADTESGPRKWLAPNDFLGQTKFGAEFTDFVFKELAQRFEEAELHLLRQAADVVVTLNQCRWVPLNRYRLNHIWIECALREEGVIALLFKFFDLLVENFDKAVADDLTLFFRVGDSFEAIEEEFRSLSNTNVEVEVIAVKLLDLFTLMETEQSVIDEDAGQLPADGSVNQGCGN